MMKLTLWGAGIFAALALLLAAPDANADPGYGCQYFGSCGPPAPVWNGQLQPTWDVPNYGGFNSPPSNCFSLSCQGAIQNPNGGRH
jgi:hypothetical protein